MLDAESRCKLAVPSLPPGPSSLPELADQVIAARADEALAQAQGIADRGGYGRCWPRFSEFPLARGEFVLGRRHLGGLLIPAQIDRTNINAWVSQETQNRINDLLALSSVNSATRAVQRD